MTPPTSSARQRSGDRFTARRGLTLVELLVTMIIVAIVGAAFTRIMIYQSRFFDAQSNQRQARGVSRGALNVMMSELRMVTVPNGIVAASQDSIVARVPFAFGVLCGSTAAASTISLVPMDSLAYAESGVTGYAWRDSTGNYAYVNASFTLAPGLLTDCGPSGIRTKTGGKVVTVQPVVPAAAGPGTPIFLFRRLEYKFGSSVAMPGRVALWRKKATANTREELVAPFDTSSHFRFYVNGSNVSQASPPAQLNEIRGLELKLVGASDRATMSTAAPTKTDLRAAVFFMNRLP